MRLRYILLVGVLLILAYEVRHLGLVVELQPEYGHPAEPGDSLVMGLVDVSFPFPFGTSYVAGSPRLVRWRLTSDREVATLDGGVLRIKGGGRVESEFGIVPPFALRTPQPVEFDVVPEAIAGITLTFERDTLAIGDTVRMRVDVRGASGRPIVADPMLMWPGSLERFGTSTDSGVIVVTARALCAGPDSIGAWIGHHAAIARLVVSARPDMPEDRSCPGRIPWSPTIQAPWSSLCTLRGGHASEPSCRDWAFRAAAQRHR